ncbi:LamG-like jellyroll fold domain-containing protein [Schlesneria sp. T3-172]|uniref:LamG-like jellyroll fold domain-containing protein n=1 Tax=Schlesneria sphaerica TaxID=3373610 RepID=UPI0037CC489C
MRVTSTVIFALFLCHGLAPTLASADDKPALDKGLVGHWPLVKNAIDISGNGLDGRVNGVTWNDPAADHNAQGASFDGQKSYLEIPANKNSALGSKDFSVAAWVWTDGSTDDIPGDILSQYDPASRRGFHVALKTNTGVTLNQANFRQLQFGIDNDKSSGWRDAGKPGKESLLSFGLITHRGRLFAGTCEPGEGQSGRVAMYAHGTTWIDCGSPSPSNAITAMASFGGELYVGTGKYRVAGSALSESPNQHLGGQIFRYAGGTNWVECGTLKLPGQPDRIEAVSGLVTFQGRQYAGSLYKPAGFFLRSETGDWNEIDVPDGKRVEAMAVYNGHLYASSYDNGHVYRFDGKTWSDLGEVGKPGENTQTYSFAVYQGRLYVGTWPSGRVYRFEDANNWTDVGRLGEELEVMGMLVHNGRLVAGTLPLAEIYQYNGGTEWQRITQLDTTPDVKYRRAWTMAEYQGQLFCSTLPNGRVSSCEIGKLTTWDEEFPTGWHHVAAVKTGGKLDLFVDGELKSSSTEFDAADYNLTTEQPLKIGVGPNDHFRGRLRHVRLYNRALSTAEAKALASAE